MSQIIPIASGKGGVGKSLLSANLAIALGQQGKKVVLADLDLGASNLHLVIGQQPGNASLGSWFTEKSDFKDIIKATDYQNVSFIAGDSQIPDMTSLKHVQKVKLIRNLKKERGTKPSFLFILLIPFQALFPYRCSKECWL